jgi:phage recombination protein Bet
MANQTEKPHESAEVDPFQCEYIPFGGDTKIKLSFNFIRRWIAAKTKRGFEPGEQDVMKFLMVCKAKKLNPFDGDAYLVGYDTNDGPVFSTIVAHQAFLKRAETHPEFDGMESGVIVRQGDEIKELVGDFFPGGSVLVGGWATVFFVNRRHPMTKRLKLSTYDKGRSLWKSNPEGMIVKCAEADALRSSFPQLIGGMYLREEVGASADQNASNAPVALQDLSGNDIPNPFHGQTRERAFADRAGQSVSGGRFTRYEQDAAAREAEERARCTTVAEPKGSPVSSFTPDDPERPIEQAGVDFGGD